MCVQLRDNKIKLKEAKWVFQDNTDITIPPPPTTPSPPQKKTKKEIIQIAKGGLRIQSTEIQKL